MDQQSEIVMCYEDMLRSAENLANTAENIIQEHHGDTVMLRNALITYRLCRNNLKEMCSYEGALNV